MQSWYFWLLSLKSKVESSLDDVCGETQKWWQKLTRLNECLWFLILNINWQQHPLICDDSLMPWRPSTTVATHMRSTCDSRVTCNPLTWSIWFIYGTRLVQTVRSLGLSAENPCEQLYLLWKKQTHHRPFLQHVVLQVKAWTSRHELS